MHFLWFIIIGAVAGWLAGKIMRGSGFGLLGDLAVGIAGAIIGGWLGRMLNITLGGSFGHLITALVGAIVLLLVIRLFKKAA